MQAQVQVQEPPRRRDPRAQISANSTVLLPLLHVSLGRGVQMPPQLALARLRFLSETGGADDFSGLSVNGQLDRSARVCGQQDCCRCRCWKYVLSTTLGEGRSTEEFTRDAVSLSQREGYRHRVAADPSPGDRFQLWRAVVAEWSDSVKTVSVS